MDTISSLREFVTNESFLRLLDSRWRGHTYVETTTDGADAPVTPGILQYLLTYHLYLALLGDQSCAHLERAQKLVAVVAGCVMEDGLLAEPDGSLSDHPAHACHIADALGTFAFYGKGLGCPQTLVDAAAAALVRIVEKHPSVRLPAGVVGRTQQMRFELRAWYWAWRVTGLERYKEACLALWKNGIHAYQHPVADHGALLRPSLHPDFTWNYACGAGTTTEYATNTHTPTYYCTEPQGFAFVYWHGLKDGVFAGDPQWDSFCRRYFLGLLRNLSRAGHTASDVEGYGVHRAWYAGCLLETSPMEAAALGARVGLSAEQSGWFRWYVERYTDFIRRSPVFEQTGLIEHQPYGHNITVERQFPALMGSRFYAHLARALYEYRVDQIKAVEPPAFASYAWWHNWLRLSTPVYETSFVGTTSLRDIPRVKNFGDPNLGCIHGGSPLATLFVGNQLLYATSNDPAGLWHVELTDYNGNTFRSCATSFGDEVAMAVKTAQGQLYSRDGFETHGDPFNFVLDAPASPDTAQGATELLWSRSAGRGGSGHGGHRFFVHSRYLPESFRVCWGASFPAGLYVQSASFNLAIPANLEPEIKLAGEWLPLADGWSCEQWPQAVRWCCAGSSVEVALAHPSSVSAAGACARAVPTNMGSPGGENSFCPYPVLQLRLAVALSSESDRIAADMSVTPLAAG